MISAATMLIQRPPLTVVERVATAMRDEDLRGWREDVEAFITATGSRCALVHVTDARWEWLFLEGFDPEDAVLAELGKVEG